MKEVESDLSRGVVVIGKCLYQRVVDQQDERVALYDDSDGIRLADGIEGRCFGVIGQHFALYVPLRVVIILADFVGQVTGKLDMIIVVKTTVIGPHRNAHNIVFIRLVYGEGSHQLKITERVAGWQEFINCCICILVFQYQHVIADRLGGIGGLTGRPSFTVISKVVEKQGLGCFCCYRQ